MQEETPNLIGQLKELGPWVLSLIALVQVWAIAAWKRFIQKGKVEIHESGSPEIGYGSFGPSIALTGTLRGLRKDVFVKHVRLKVTRQKDSAQFSFNWRAFRPHTIPLGAQQASTVELASSFLLTPNDPYKYNIFFVDDSFIAEYKPKIEPLVKKWQEFVKEQLDSLDKADQKPNYSLLQNPAFSEALFEAFTKMKDALDAYTAMSHALYWQAGEYQLRIIVETSRPNTVFEKEWRFSLSEKDIDNLRLNSIATLREICGLSMRYNIASPEYLK